MQGLGRARRFAAPGQLAAFACVLGAAIVERRLVMANADVAWLLTVAEKWIDGARLYVDVLENNPPFAVWIYAPAVLLSRAVGLRAEVMVDVLFMAASLASVWGAARILRGVDDARPWLAPVALADLTVLPAACFGEREHLALIAFLPPLALAIARARGAGAGLVSVAVIGCLEGAVLAIKPHFALAIAAAAGAGAFVRGSPRLLFAPEHFIAGAIFVGFAASTFVFYPAYWSDVMPVLRLLYLPVRTPFLEMLYGHMATTLVILCGLAIVIRIAGGPSIATRARIIAFAAAAGFFLAAIVQGKGWPYHFYPALALLVIVVADLARAATRTMVMGATTMALAAHFWMLFNIGLDMSVLSEPMRAIKERPRVLSIASDFAAAFPVTRQVDGVWVGRAYSRWVSFHTLGLVGAARGDAALLEAYRAAEAADRRDLTRDILVGKPDLIVIERAPFDFLAWARRDRAIAAPLGCYAPASRRAVGEPEKPGGNGLDVEIFALRAPAPLADGCEAINGEPGK